MMISFSVLGEAILQSHLPKTSWSYLVENLGYSLGFLLVIMGRMQLFTENTITTVLPIMVKWNSAMFGRLIRLWIIVLTANVCGAFAIALFYAHTNTLSSEIHEAITSLSKHAIHIPAGESFTRAIPAGVLIAAIVWMLPQAESSAFFVILTFTWLIAVGDFTHIIAGSFEMAFLMVNGELGITAALFGFFLPVLMGNIVGGTAIFSLLAWGQVKEEIKQNTRKDDH